MKNNEKEPTNETLDNDEYFKVPETCSEALIAAVQWMNAAEKVVTHHAKNCMKKDWPEPGRQMQRNFIQLAENLKNNPELDNQLRELMDSRELDREIYKAGLR